MWLLRGLVSLAIMMVRDSDSSIRECCGVVACDMGNDTLHCLSTVATVGVFIHRGLRLAAVAILLRHVVVLGNLLHEVSVHQRMGVLTPGKVQVSKALNELGVHHGRSGQVIDQSLETQ